MFERIKKLIRIGDLWRRVELLEVDNDLLKQQNKDLGERVGLLEKRTVSERTLEKEVISPRQILDEWLNGASEEDDADGK